VDLRVCDFDGKLSNEMKRNKIDFDTVDQIRRSGVSVGANVREGKASSSRKELARFYSIALRSANETDFWFEVITKGYDYKSERLTNCWEDLKQIEKVIATIIIKLNEKSIS
jgi:four helix bundle protein